jgi:hypothetical protein
VLAVQKPTEQEPELTVLHVLWPPELEPVAKLMAEMQSEPAAAVGITMFPV